MSLITLSLGGGIKIRRRRILGAQTGAKMEMKIIPQGKQISMIYRFITTRMHSDASAMTVKIATRSICMHSEAHYWLQVRTWSLQVSLGLEVRFLVDLDLSQRTLDLNPPQVWTSFTSACTHAHNA